MDLIERRDAIDMAYGCEDEFGKDVIFRLVDYIRQLPSAEPDIIRCKDCKYMRRDVVFDQCWCNRSSRVSPIDDDEYCSRADRRKE